MIYQTYNSTVLISSYNHSIWINQRHPWEKKILYPIWIIHRPKSLWLFCHLNYGDVSMGTAPTARQESCHGLVYKGKNINMISLNTEIAFEPFEDLSYWNQKHAYRHQRYVINNLICLTNIWKPTTLSLVAYVVADSILVDVTRTWNTNTGARICDHVTLNFFFFFFIA